MREDIPVDGHQLIHTFWRPSEQENHCRTFGNLQGETIMTLPPTHPEIPPNRHMVWSMFGSGELLATNTEKQNNNKDLGNWNTV